MREKIMIVFQRNDTGEVMDLEIPTNISITELIFGLNACISDQINELITNCPCAAENSDL